MGSLPSEKMKLSVASENSREIEIVAAELLVQSFAVGAEFHQQKDSAVESF